MPVSYTHLRAHTPNVITISSTVLVGLTVVTDRQTDTHTQCNIGNNTWHRCTVCLRCGLRISTESQSNGGLVLETYTGTKITSIPPIIPADFIFHPPPPPFRFPLHPSRKTQPHPRSFAAITMSCTHTRTSKRHQA